MRYLSHPARGDIVSVVYNRSGLRIVVCMVVKKSGHKICCTWIDGLMQRHNYIVRLRDEGRTWSREANDPEGKALEAFLALT